jgi:hypothetical protein
MHPLVHRLSFTCNLLGARKVAFSRVAAFLSLSCVVHQILCYFSKRSSFFSKIDDNPTSSPLCRFDTFLDSMSQVRATSANVTKIIMSQSCECVWMTLVSLVSIFPCKIMSHRFVHFSIAFYEPSKYITSVAFVVNATR